VVTDELGAGVRSDGADSKGRALNHHAEDPSRPPPPAELTATILTGDGWATIVVRSPGDVEVVNWPIATSRGSDLAVVDALARLQLAAQRCGCAIRLRGVEDDLLGVIDLVGLGAVLTGRSARQGARQPECLEQLEVEEVVVPDDPVP
jgi:hypothetical protein